MKCLSNIAVKQGHHLLKSTLKLYNRLEIFKCIKNNHLRKLLDGAAIVMLGLGV